MRHQGVEHRGAGTAATRRRRGRHAPDTPGSGAALSDDEADRYELAVDERPDRERPTGLVRCEIRWILMRPEHRLAQRTSVRDRQLADVQISHPGEASGGDTGRDPTMRSLLVIFVLAALVVLPASAGASSLQSLKKAKLQRATGTLTISESRCPGGSTDCGNAKLESTFATTAVPRTQSAPAPPGFPLGASISGRGTGECSAESPTTFVTGPDGSAQFLSGASRVEPGSFQTTRIAAVANKRGVRIAWLEPLTPGLACDYFEQPDTALALPASPALPSALISPYLSSRALRRKHFSVTIGGSQEWTEQEADGTNVTGQANWRLRLEYKR